MHKLTTFTDRTQITRVKGKVHTKVHFLFEPDEKIIALHNKDITNMLTEPGIVTVEASMRRDENDAEILAKAEINALIAIVDTKSLNVYGEKKCVPIIDLSIEMSQPMCDPRKSIEEVKSHPAAMRRNSNHLRTFFYGAHIEIQEEKPDWVAPLLAQEHSENVNYICSELTNTKNQIVSTGKGDFKVAFSAVRDFMDMPHNRQQEISRPHEAAKSAISGRMREADFTNETRKQGPEGRESYQFIAEKNNILVLAVEEVVADHPYFSVLTLWPLYSEEKNKEYKEKGISMQQVRAARKEKAEIE